jgi:hypothetical protein
MNKSIETVALNSKDERVRELTRQLFELAGKKVRVKFVKKDGNVRTMDCVPRNQFNALFGIESTKSGKAMVKTKALHNMITVAEIIDSGFRARTINLETVIGDITPLS